MDTAHCSTTSTRRSSTLPQGCPFRPRCPYAFDKCVEEPELVDVGRPGHQSACWLPTDTRKREKLRRDMLGQAAAVVATAADSE